MESFLFGLSATECVGYLASAVVMISFLNRHIIRLRIINSIGCTLFVAYGVMLDISIPIVVTNGFILLIHFYYLFMNKPKAA